MKIRKRGSYPIVDKSKPVKCECHNCHTKVTLFSEDIITEHNLQLWTCPVCSLRQSLNNTESALLRKVDAEISSIHQDFETAAEIPLDVGSSIEFKHCVFKHLSNISHDVENYINTYNSGHSFILFASFIGGAIGGIGLTLVALLL